MRRVLLFCQIPLWAAVFGTVRGVVHDPNHRPVRRAAIEVKSVSSDFVRNVATDEEGSFEASALPVGAYRLTVIKEGFAPSVQEVLVASSSAPVLHFQLAVGARREEVNVSETAAPISADQMTPTTLIGRGQIAETPGADLSNSLAAITDYVPGAYMTHDQLHVRGGHQRELGC